MFFRSLSRIARHEAREERADEAQRRELSQKLGREVSEHETNSIAAWMQDAPRADSTTADAASITPSQTSASEAEKKQSIIGCVGCLVALFALVAFGVLYVSFPNFFGNLSWISLLSILSTFLFALAIVLKVFAALASRVKNLFSSSAAPQDTAVSDSDGDGVSNKE